MSFVGMNVTGAEEPKARDAGRYRMVVLGVPEMRDSKAGKPMIVVRTGFRDHPEALSVTTFLSLPHGDDKPEARSFKELQIKRFLTQFNIPYDASGFNLEDFANAEADVDVILGEPNEQGSQFNELRLARLPNEQGVVEAKAKKRA